jgi:hypothetical protein
MKHTLTILLVTASLGLFAQDSKMDTTSWSHVVRFRAISDSLLEANSDIKWVEGLDVRWELHYPERTLKKIYIIAGFEYYKGGQLTEFEGPVYLIEDYRKDGTIKKRVEVHNLKLPITYKKVTWYNKDGTVKKEKVY